MGDQTQTFRGKPPYSQGSADDKSIRRLGTLGVDDMQTPERPDPMMDITNGIGAGTFLPASLSARVAQDKALIDVPDYQYAGSTSVDMALASSSRPFDEEGDNRGSGPVFPGGK